MVEVGLARARAAAPPAPARGGAAGEARPEGPDGVESRLEAARGERVADAAEGRVAMFSVIVS